MEGLRGIVFGMSLRICRNEDGISILTLICISCCHVCFAY